MTVKLKKENLQYLFNILNETHRIIGPKIENNTIVLSEISFHQLPIGYIDEQSAGSYRLIKKDDNYFFSYSVGFDSFKRFLNPPYMQLSEFNSSKKGFKIKPLLSKDKPFAFFAMRSCDLQALRLYDKIFNNNVVKDPYYISLRNDLIIIALNCNSPSNNCFCSSMGIGPELKDGYDLLLTELSDSFLIESGSSEGYTILKSVPHEDINEKDILEKNRLLKVSYQSFKKSLKFNKISTIIYKNFEHPLWQQIALRDLECGNCTQVCPTCFCNSIFDKVYLKSITNQFLSGLKIRVWDSCFSRNFARVHGGNFRLSRKSRYRHWFAHKLAYFEDQFGLPGCVGCGRCITWCPAGIDITEELEALISAK